MKMSYLKSLSTYNKDVTSLVPSSELEPLFTTPDGSVCTGNLVPMRTWASADSVCTNGFYVMSIYFTNQRTIHQVLTYVLRECVVYKEA